MIQYLLGAIGLLVGLVGWLFVKKQSAEALLQNTDTKEKVNDLEAQKKANDAQEQLEQMKRDLLKQNGDQNKNQPIDPKDFN